MNFVIDLTVGEFIELHAKSRLVENPEQVVKRIVEAANYLAGEKNLNMIRLLLHLAVDNQEHS